VTVGRNVERLTFDPGLTVTPALSPDGKLLAYASDRSGRDDLDIWVDQLHGGTPVRLTDDPAEDRDPDFSADGSQIVFRSDRNGGGAYLVPALGGSQRLLIKDARTPRFSPDGTRIAYWTGQFRGDPSGGGSSTFVVTVAGGTPTHLVADFLVARDPVWAPDGQSLLVLGRRDRSSSVADSFDWWWVPVDGRRPQRTGLLNHPRWRDAQQREQFYVGEWTPSGVLIAVYGELWTVPLAPQTGAITGEGSQIAVGAGSYRDPTLTRDGQIVFSDTTSHRVIERAGVTGNAVTSPPITLYADSNRQILRASTTQDGDLMVFERQAGAHTEIWQKDLRSGHEQTVLALNTDSFVNPVVSSDGTRIAYSMPKSGGGPANGNSDGYAVDVGGGVPRKICSNCSVYEFLSDSRRVVVSDDELAIRIIDLDSQMTYDAITVRDSRINRPSVSPDDRWMAFRQIRGSAGKVFVTALRDRDAGPAPPSTWTQIDEPTSTGRPAGWSSDSRLLYLLLDTDGFRCLWAQRIDDGGRPVGPPFAVRHFHDRRGADNISTSLGNAVTRQGFLYETARPVGSLWRLTTTATP
jgi:Tol biopolymer transport system component